MNTIKQIRLGLRAAFGSSQVRALLAVTGTLIGLASVFYWWVEGWHPVDAVYFSVMTIATVGFGDFAPKTMTGRIFTIVYVVSGLGLFAATAGAIANSILRGSPRNDREN